jgi:hypothetical protein
MSGKWVGENSVDKKQSNNTQEKNFRKHSHAFT